MVHIPASLSHAYILTGGSALSRAAFARQLARAYVCESASPPCGVCRHCEKAAKGVHPDISVLSPAEGKREIVAEQTRQLRTDAYIRPNEASRKVYIVDPADAMNPTAQNTLLKVLEEGPPYAAFLLTAAQPGALLETIRSRCETLWLPPEEDPPDPELLAKAQELAALLLQGDELSLALWLTGQECAKLKGDQVLDLFQLTRQALRPSLASQPRRAVPVMRLLGEFAAMRPYHVGAGHLLGALAARSAFSSSI